MARKLAYKALYFRYLVLLCTMLLLKVKEEIWRREELYVAKGF